MVLIYFIYISAVIKYVFKYFFVEEGTHKGRSAYGPMQDPVWPCAACGIGWGSLLN